MTKSKKSRVIYGFGFNPGTVVARKYEVINKIGTGWEGEVYRVRERGTHVERAAKFFFPQRNQDKKSSTICAQKLFKLRSCPILLPYHVQEELRYDGHEIVCLLSDYVEGELLNDFLLRQPGKKLPHFQALHLLHTLVKGLEPIHEQRDYHGDLHPENIIIKRRGIGFDIRVLDLFHWGRAKKEHLQDDIFDLIKIFYESLGGPRTYSNQPAAVKYICCGMRRDTIAKRFPSMPRLRQHLESLQWS